MLTSLGQRPDGASGLDLVHLTKPVKAAALRDTLARALGAAAPEQDAGAGPRALPRLRLLLAEDNVVNQRVATLLLQRLGQRPDVVSDGAEAVRAVRDRDYDLVLMDVQMPVLDGLEATRQIRATVPAARQPRIVAMTANALTEDRDACLLAGMDEHLGKPVRPEELRRLLHKTADLTPGATPAPPTPEPDTTPGAGTAAAVDPTVLGELTERLGDRGAAIRVSLVDAWLRESEKRLGDLRAGVQAGDGDLVASTAHALRSGSASLGALRLAAALERVELDLRAGLPVDLAAELPGLEHEVEQAADGLRALRDG
jgi:CheY-like chemotaxis protein